MFKLIAAVMMLSASLAFAGGELSTVRGTGTAGTSTKKVEKTSRVESKKAAAPSTAAPSSDSEKTADTK